MPEQFICLEYNNVSFLISKEEVFSATCCQPQNFISMFSEKKGGVDKRLIFENKFLNFIDFDLYVKQLIGIELKSEIRTSVILKNQNLFSSDDLYALVTSADCKVKNLNLSDFSLLSDNYAYSMKSKGIIAFNFDSDLVRYLINPCDFLKRAV